MDKQPSVYTIGFAQKPLRTFVELLQQGGVTKLVDIRLNNTSQLAGYAKKDDLAYIMKLVGVTYAHELDLAPTPDIFEDIQKKRIPWNDFEARFLDLLHKRKVEERFGELLGDDTICFLCSEHKPHHCHRRLIAEYLQQNGGQEIGIVHLF
ncbi:DUF488 domain-containing protein [Paenibacillus silvisoli]|uniref:DUF488 domain-containing protein n=1 Tax=Paenibacillus silvisoli TaxID=3110539 RepID=UPI0028041EAE|nr:DUF488 domain-containing protein [Paenibacillus silvisoli]